MSCDYCATRVCIDTGGWVILANKKTECIDCYTKGIHRVF